jgi:ABC-type glycerol-3-phosphate transport system substrate-binding protein
MKSMTAAAVGLLALSLAAGGALAQASAPAAELPADREEIIITHQRQGPLSDWAAMQEHSAEYRRLKAKFDPSTGAARVDNDAADRQLAGHSNASDSFEQESAREPTPPVVQAIKDAVVPP